MAITAHKPKAMTRSSAKNFQIDGMNCCVASLQWRIFSGAFDFLVPYYYDRCYYDFEFLLEKHEILFSRIKKTRERGVGHG